MMCHQNTSQSTCLKVHVNTSLYDPLRNFAVFFAIDLGCRTNCFPLRVPSLLALVVAEYSADVKDFIAFSGKYLSPVFALGLPDLVRHFCFVQDFKLFWDFASAISFVTF